MLFHKQDEEAYLILFSFSKPSSSTNALPVQLDSQGRVKYDALVRQGHRKDKVQGETFNRLIFSNRFMMYTDDGQNLCV